MSDAAIEAVALTYAVGGNQLVTGIDIAVDAGEFIAVLGPNGAGKSTLLSLLSGDLVPTEGTVYYSGSPIARLSDAERALHRAVLSQRAPTDIPFTAESVVSLGRYPHRHEDAISPTRDAEVIASAMAATDTSHLGNRTYSSLSGGEQTRVAIARVLAQDTPIALVDEPTAALDVYHQERILHILRSAANDGKTVVAVHHDLNSAITYADRVVVMAGGKVVVHGPVEEVLEDSLLSEVYGMPMAVLDHPLRPGKIVLVDDAAHPPTERRRAPHPPRQN
jgi:iron complex transport system ATP-binding protein